MTAGKNKNVPMCIVTVGFHHLLMPVSDGMKAVTLLSGAVECESQYGGELRMTYVVGDQPRVEFTTVRHSQIRMSEPARPAKTLLLEKF